MVGVNGGVLRVRGVNVGDTSVVIIVIRYVHAVGGEIINGRRVLIAGRGDGGVGGCGETEREFTWVGLKRAII